MDEVVLSQLNIQLTELKKLPTPNGDVLHAFKQSESINFRFGEAYFSFINHNKIKAWKLHKQMTLNLIVPLGAVRFVFCLRKIGQNDQFSEVEISSNNYKRLTIPPNLWFGFKGLDKKNLVVNIASHEHDPDEVITSNLTDFNYKW